jgi:hypothetical protein
MYNLAEKEDYLYAISYTACKSICAIFAPYHGDSYAVVWRDGHEEYVINFGTKYDFHAIPDGRMMFCKDDMHYFFNPDTYTIHPTDIPADMQYLYGSDKYLAFEPREYVLRTPHKYVLYPL